MSRRRRNQGALPPPPDTSPAPEDPPGRPWYGLYVGSTPEPDGSPGYGFASSTESSVLVIGPPRSGKTSSIVIPCVLDAPAAVVSTSTKTDVLAATLLRRWTVGNCYVFDPSGTIAIPEGAVRLRWSPVTGCENFEQAVATAHSLASAGRPGSGLTESAHWIERAEALLAPLLFAAANKGRDMATVCRWVLSRDLREPQAVLESSGHQMAEAILAGVGATDERERSGIFSTAAGLLSAYRSEQALAAAAEPNFDPVAFARSTDTVYVCAPAHIQDQMAPLVVALLDQIRTAVFARPRNAAPVVFALDEVAGIAPLPGLPTLAAEGGGQGLITLACLQDLSQARIRWGEAAEGFFTLFNTKIVFSGVGDHRTLQLISSLAGELAVPIQSVNRPAQNKFLIFVGAQNPIPASVSTSTTWRPRLTVQEVSSGRPGCALCIDGSAVFWVGVPPWWQVRFWNFVAHRPRSLWGQQVRPAALKLPSTYPP